jgi:macrolide-specific efflux system membrane fusion protein
MAIPRLTYTHARRRRRWPWWAGGAVILVLIGLGIQSYTGKAKVEPEYRDVPVALGDLKILISAAGDVCPQNRIELRPPLSGRIDSILVREGDEIKKGQVLAWISSTDRASLLDAARAKGPDEVARWEDAYKPTPLVAPLAGFIIARRAEPGQSTGGDAPLVMADRLIVKAQVDETDLRKVHVGLPAEVALDAYPDVKLNARVDHVAYESRSVNNVTVYDIEVELLDPPAVLRSGMTATVSVAVAGRKHVLLVPAESLSEAAQGGGLTVLVKRPKGSPAETRKVELGMSDGALVEITKGVKPGEILLVNVHGVPPTSLAQATNPFAFRMRGRH